MHTAASAKADYSVGTSAVARHVASTVPRQNSPCCPRRTARTDALLPLVLGGSIRRLPGKLMRWEVLALRHCAVEPSAANICTISHRWLPHRKNIVKSL